jgi:hypothetical protein
MNWMRGGSKRQYDRALGAPGVRGGGVVGVVAASGVRRAVGVPDARGGLDDEQVRLGVDVKVIITPPCIFCMENC